MTVVFAYGSLLDPASLAGTLPTVDAASCVGAALAGYARAFSLAFPNDESQSDKAYFDRAGRRPPIVLFCDAVDVPGGLVNGVLVPVSDEHLRRLTGRERRYEVVDVSGAVVAEGAGRSLDEPCVVFLGRARYTAARDVARGVVPRAYLDSVVRGVDYWDARLPGFASDFRRSTTFPPPGRVVDLRRVDYG